MTGFYTYPEHTPSGERHFWDLRAGVARKPWFRPSSNVPTIWPAVLIPKGSVLALGGAGWEIKGGEGGAVFEKTMADPSGIIERPHDLARRIDPVGLGERGARDSNSGESGAVFQKAMALPCGIAKPPYDLARRVDPIGLGERGTGDINGGEGA